MFEAYQNKDDTYPIPIVVTDDWGQAILSNDLADFAFTVPESNLFFELNKRDQLTPHSLVSNPASALPDSLGLSFEKTVVKYTYAPDSVVYLPDDNEPGIFLKRGFSLSNETDVKAKNWSSALLMQG